MVLALTSVPYRINRNILECKDVCTVFVAAVFFSVLIETYWNVKCCRTADGYSLSRRINRNILECKRNWNRDCLHRHCVLIETYWNVKITDEVVKNAKVTVLIETYWNVKSETLILALLMLLVLIETYWNVKNTRQAVCQLPFCVLIETYWNVNIHLILLQLTGYPY